MSATAARPRSPVAERVRARLAEIGLSESAASEAMGWTRSVLSTILRRVDAGGGWNSETLIALEKILGRSTHWILTGEETKGVHLRDCEGWAEAAKLAQERYELTDEQIATVGATTFPIPPRYVEPSLIRALADAI